MDPFAPKRLSRPKLTAPAVLIRQLIGVLVWIAAKPGISEFYGRLRFNVSQGIQRIDGLLERLAIEGGSHCEWLTVLSR
jgi:predicted small integral membrane protein